MSAAKPPSKPLWEWLATLTVAFATAAAITLASVPVRAQAGIPVIRDAEIKQLLRDYAKPIFRVAGLSEQNINAKMADAAISLLHAALVKEPESLDAYTQLAMAYGRKNHYADADLASAQAAFARGDNKTARGLAARAQQRFPIGSPGWVRADDIVEYKSEKKSPLAVVP